MKTFCFSTAPGVCESILHLPKTTVSVTLAQINGIFGLAHFLKIQGGKVMVGVLFKSRKGVMYEAGTKLGTRLDKTGSNTD